MTNTEKLSKGLKQGQSLISGFVSKLGGMSTAVAGVGAAASAAAVAGIGVLTAKVTELANASFSLADDLGALSAKTGLTIKTLSELRYVAQLNDVEFETLANGIKKLNLNLAEAAATGKGATADALKSVGLSAKTLAESGADEALGPIADAIAAIENPAEQAAKAADIFGSKIGPELLPLLQGGSAGIEELRKEAHRLGVVMSDDTANRLNEFNDAWDRLTFALEGFGTLVANTVAPALTELTTRLTDATGETNNNAAAFRDFADLCVDALALISIPLELIVRQFRLVRSTLYAVGASAIESLTPVADLVDRIAAATGRLSSLGDFTRSLTKGLRDSAISDAGKATSTSTAAGSILSFWEEYKNKASAANAEAAKTPRATTDIAEATIAAVESTDKLIEKLKDQIKYFDLSAEQAEIQKLADQGASKAQIAEATALTEQLKSMSDWKEVLAEQDKTSQERAKAAADAAKKQTDDLAAAAKSVFEETRTPIEKFEAELAAVKDLFARGLIDPDTYNRKVNQLAKDATSGIEQPGQVEKRFAAALEEGTQEARAAILTAQGAAGNKPDDKLLTEQKKQTTFLQQIAKAIGSTPETVLALQ